MILKNTGAWMGNNKRPLTSLAIALVAIAAMTWWTDRSFENRFRQDLDRTLSTLLNINHTAMDLWIQEHMRRVEFAAESPDILTITEKLLALPRNRETLLAAQEEPRSMKFA